MKLPELIELIWLDRDNLDPIQVNKAIIKNYCDGDLVNLIQIFLRGIGSSSCVSGQVITTLWGIADYYKEHSQLTPRQRVYVIAKILDYWQEVSCEMRATLML